MMIFALPLDGQPVYIWFSKYRDLGELVQPPKVTCITLRANVLISFYRLQSINRFYSRQRGP